MDTLGCIGAPIGLAILVVLLTGIGYDYSSTQHRDRVQYVMDNHGQTTESLTMGLQLIVNGEDPQQVDEFAAKHGMERGK